ncbi:General stress protein 16U [Streptomyces sp. ADI91-18]|uniref:TerD family protein n=1 Tax=Streptomyces sp. ADI91-18 TaxID=1522755 RepID=UPI000F552E5C|nr:TerD family protein [Streptomyces sp. ADI91-18]RPK53850.1 General stress protein 16U [Streptomyces sp. ADI91-18]
MTAELVRGQNHPLSRSRVEIRVSAHTPVLALVSAGDDAGRLPGPEAVAHPGARALAGLEVPGELSGRHRFTVDLDSVGPAVHRVGLVLVLPPGGPARFGAVPAPYMAVAEPEGAEIAGYTLAGLDSETAVVALELYRRQGGWKVRAVGQGYAAGLGALLADAGLPGPAAVALAAQVMAAAPPAAAESAVAPATAVTSAPATAAEGATPTAPAPAAHAEAVMPMAPEAAAPAAAAPAVPAEGAVPASVEATPTVPQGVRVSREVSPAPPAAQPPDPYVEAPGSASGDAPPTISYAHPRRRPTSAEPPEPGPQRTQAPGPGEPPRPVAGDAAGWSMEERLYNQVWGMFEDLARTVSAYRSAVEFADARMDRELGEALSDPRQRLGGSGDAARDAARERRDELVDRARAVLDRDLAQLVAETEVVEPALPAPYARWDSPVWHDGRAAALPEESPLALRLGDLHLPERPDLRIPMLMRLPLERGIWIDNGRTGSEAAMAMDTDRLRLAAMDMAVAHAVRLLAVHPGGRYAVHVIDAAGAGAASLAPLVRSGVLAEPPAAGPGGVTRTLAALTRRVDLVQMALRAGAPEDLPPDVDTAGQLLIVHDFPHGFDDRAVTQLRYLADEGPAVGVHLLMVADRDEASAYGPLLDPLWRSLMRLSPVPDSHLADPWVGHHWTFEPDLPPRGSQVLDRALDRIAAARRGSRP